MGKNVGFAPAQQIELGAGRQEFEAGRGVGFAAVAHQPLGEFFGQRMQMQHVGGGIVQLGRCKRLGGPVRGLLLLG